MIKKNNPILGQWFKKQESIADVLGGMICAELGMDPVAYVDGMNQTFNGVAPMMKESLPFVDQAALNDAVNGNRTFGDLIPDGKKMHLLALDAQLAVLADESHPKDSERVDQLRRLLEVIKPQCNPANTLAGKFIEACDAAKANALSDLEDIKATFDVYPQVRPQPTKPVADDQSDSTDPTPSES